VILEQDGDPLLGDGDPVLFPRIVGNVVARDRWEQRQVPQETMDGEISSRFLRFCFF